MARGLEYMERPPDMAVNPVEQQPMQQAPAPRGGGGGGGSPQLIKPMEDLYVTGQDAEGNDLTQEYMNQVQELNRFVTMNAARGLDPTNPSNLDANNPEAARVVAEFNQRKAQVDALGNELKQAQKNYTQVRDKQLEGKLYVGDGVQQGQVFGNQQAQDAARMQTERREVDDYIEFYSKNTPKTRAELEAQQRYYQSSKAAVDSLFAKGEINRDEYNAMINLLPKPQDSLQVKETDSVTDSTSTSSNWRQTIDPAYEKGLDKRDSVALGSKLLQIKKGVPDGNVQNINGKPYVVTDVLKGETLQDGRTVVGEYRAKDGSELFMLVRDSDGRTEKIPMKETEDGGLDLMNTSRLFLDNFEMRQFREKAEERGALDEQGQVRAETMYADLIPEFERIASEKEPGRTAVANLTSRARTVIDKMANDKDGMGEEYDLTGGDPNTVVTVKKDGKTFVLRGGVKVRNDWGDGVAIEPDENNIFEIVDGQQVPYTGGQIEDLYSENFTIGNVNVADVRKANEFMKGRRTTNRTGAPAATARRGGVTPTSEAEVNAEMEDFGFSN